MNASTMCAPHTDRERGGVLLLLAILMPIVLGFAGLAVDVRNGYVVRSMLQHAVDDGALSALRWSTQVFDSPGAQNVVGQAVQESLWVAQQELQSQGLAGISSVTATVSGGQLTLTASARVPTYFIVLFGISQWVPQVRAATALWIPQSGPASAATVPGAISGQLALPSAGSTSTGSPGSETGEGNGSTNSGLGSTSIGSEPISSGPPSSTDPVDLAGPCNCDAIAADDALSAQDALERMGATPADPGPFQGDMTSQLGFGEMQSSGASAASGDASSSGGDLGSAGSGDAASSGGDSGGGDSGSGGDSGGGDSGGGDSGGGDSGSGGDQ